MENKIIATKIKAKDLVFGDLFSTAGQLYWDCSKNNHSIGEKVYIRTQEKCPIDQEDEEIYKITFENGTK